MGHRESHTEALSLRMCAMEENFKALWSGWVSRQRTSTSNILDYVHPGFFAPHYLNHCPLPRTLYGCEAGYHCSLQPNTVTLFDRIHDG